MQPTDRPGGEGELHHARLRNLASERDLDHAAAAVTRNRLRNAEHFCYWPRRALGANNRPPLCFHLGLLNAAISRFALRESNRTRAPSVKDPGSPIISAASTGSMVAKSIVQLGKD